MTATVALRRAQRRRAVVAMAVLAVAAVALTATDLLLGKASLSPPEVVATILGQGSAMSGFVVGELRLPRILTALVVGASLGVSGAVFQTALRNPLASPDIIGVTASASVAGIVSIVVFGLSGLALAAAVIAGALVAAAAMYLLAWRSGMDAYRLVLVGIGVAAICTGAISFVLTRGNITDAQIALVWLTGSLNSSSWAALVPVAICAAVIMVVIGALRRPLRLLELGDDPASALGVPVERTRVAAVATAVALAAVAVSTSGPLGFVALASGQIARRLLSTGSAGIAVSGFVGGVGLLAADLVAQFAWQSTALPTGVVTGIVGAPFLIWLLVRASRSRGA